MVSVTSLAGFALMSPEERRAVMDASAKGLPDRVIGHRLGDFVFAFHGIDFSTADPNLWVVIWSPDPSQNSLPQQNERFPVGLAGGKVIRIAFINFAAALADQNALRLRFNLAPLTNPFIVTHAKPMLSPPTGD